MRGALVYVFAHVSLHYVNCKIKKNQNTLLLNLLRWTNSNTHTHTHRQASLAKGGKPHKCTVWRHKDSEWKWPLFSSCPGTSLLWFVSRRTQMCNTSQGNLKIRVREKDATVWAENVLEHLKSQIKGHHSPRRPVRSSRYLKRHCCNSLFILF